MLDAGGTGAPGSWAPGADAPEVSVVIPVHGAADGLAEQLTALAGQQGAPAWELVLADNGTRPGALDAVLAAVPALPHVRVVDATARPGKPFAVNTAVARARGSSFVHLDADDVVAPGYLAAMAAALRANPVVGARLDAGRLNAPWVRARREPLQENRLEVLLGYRPAVVGASLGVRREAWAAVGGYDERMTRQQDVDLSWRLQDAGYAPVFVPDAVVHYRYRSDLASLWRQEVEYGRFEALLYARHRSRGLPRRRLRRTVRGWVAVVLALPRCGTRAGRGRLVSLAGAAVGRLRGSLEHRVLYL